MYRHSEYISFAKFRVNIRSERATQKYVETFEWVNPRDRIHAFRQFLSYSDSSSVSEVTGEKIQ